MAGEFVLITGATGMIGFRTLVHLLEAGYKVRAAVRSQASFDKISTLKPVVPYASQLESIVVPDITVSGAYDEAVKGVKYIVHVASPIASNVPKDVDYDSFMIQPAIRGTVGMLESASKVTGVERIVITASMLALTSVAASVKIGVINESTRAGNTKGPFKADLLAYEASKALAFQATEKFMAENKPAFDIVNIMPSFVLGRDDTVTEAKNIAKGTNAMLMGTALGYPRETPAFGTSVHVDDVAKVHVLALNPAIEGNQDFIANSHPLVGMDWADSSDIIKKHFPKACADGVFKFDSIPKPVTVRIQVDGSKAEKTFGFTFKSFEEQVVSVVGHFLELIGRRLE